MKNVKSLTKSIMTALNFHKKKIISLGMLLVAGVVFFVFQVEILYLINKDESKIGWVTDIHAGANKKRAFANEDGSDNTLYPKKFREYFPAALDEMKKKGIRTVIASGDNTNLTEYHYARELQQIADAKGMNMLWVRGNHDFQPGENKDVMSEFGVKDYFYTYDTREARVIVLDINFNGPSITDENVNWLKEKLAETNLPVIVVAHSPTVDYDLQKIMEPYIELNETLRESGKVKFMLSGHTHKDAQMEKEGILYRTAWPLTQKNHMGSYYILDMANSTIQHFENYIKEK